jgi:hypothetical protein
MKARARFALILLFVGLLLTPWLIRRFGDEEIVAEPGEGALDRYGFVLTESAKAAELNFLHQGPTLDPKIAHIMPEVASMGASVSVVDFDGDGRLDVYATNSSRGSRNHMFRNRGDGTFEEVAEFLGIADVNQPQVGVSMGSVWGDYDNDGFEDLLVYKYGRPELFHNDAGQRFTAVGPHAGLPARVNANAATWLDFDRDGHLDLFIAGYYSEAVNLWELTSTKMMPESFEYANNG